MQSAARSVWPRFFSARTPWRLAAAGLLILAAGCSDLPLQPVDAETATGGKPGQPDLGPSMSTAMVVGAALWVDPYSNARRQADAWRSTRPADAAQMDKIAQRPQAVWFGDWNPDPYAHVAEVTRKVVSAGALPTYVLYNIPQRDCGLYSAGGAASADGYLRWVSEVVRGIGDSRAAVILEPDAVAAMDCLSAADQQARLDMLRRAIQVLKRTGRIAVYVDAGNARWHAPVTIAERLRRAGIDLADGFALNVSNFVATGESVRYGEQVSALVGDKHFVVDTSRNGLGPAADAPESWCNPPGRALGNSPTTRTGHPLADAFLWIKSPGESDGTCKGGPRAGEWWPEYALGLAQRSTL